MVLIVLVMTSQHSATKEANGPGIDIMVIVVFCHCWVVLALVALLLSILKDATTTIYFMNSCM